MAKLLTGMYIRDVHLNHGSCHGADSILQSNGSMRISPCIQHDAVIIKTHFVYFVDHLTFHIRLIIRYFNVRISMAQFHQIVFK